jgi:hypothetical protein
MRGTLLWVLVAIICTAVLAGTYAVSDRYMISSSGPITAWRVDTMTGQVSYCGVVTNAATKHLECVPVKDAPPAPK